MTINKSQYEQEKLTLTNLIQHVLTAVRCRLGMDFGFVSEFKGGSRIFRYIDGVLANVEPGDGTPLAESYCYYIVKGEMPSVLGNALDDPIAAKMPATRDLPIGSHISVPIKLSTGAVFGTLCCFSYRPKTCLGGTELALLQLGSSIVANILETAGVQRDDYLVVEEAVRDTIEKRAIDIVYQPIYSISDDQITSFEALARFPREPRRAPDCWFADAERVGMGVDLEFLAVEEALAGFLSLPRNVSMSLNLSPSSIATDRFIDLFQSVPLDRVILEVTEHAAIDSYETLKFVLEPFRARGLRLAIDDVGAGYSSFRHVLDLSPDLIKLDISLTRNVDLDRGRQALAEAICQFGRRTGAEVVAEGVETRDELATLVRAGITKAQGYLISKPVALETASGFSLNGLATEITSKDLRL